MRVALLQIRLNVKSAAANLQALNSAVDEAAQGDPAPDLLVLPGACDTCGAVRSPRGMGSANLEGAKENIAFKARDWGVFVAAGLHFPFDDRRGLCAVLFDPDGDIVARSGPASCTKEGESAALPQIWTSPVGEMGVFEPTSARLGEKSMLDYSGRAVIALPICSGLTVEHQRTADANIATFRGNCAAGSGTYWAVVTEAGRRGSSDAEHGRGTFLCAPDGTIVAAADGCEETIVYAEVPIAPATSSSPADT